MITIQYHFLSSRNLSRPIVKPYGYAGRLRVLGDLGDARVTRGLPEHFSILTSARISIDKTKSPSEARRGASMGQKVSPPVLHSLDVASARECTERPHAHD